MCADNTKQAARRLLDRDVVPVLIAYVEWVLREAAQRGIHRLYFLARDGYVLQKIAERFCAAHRLDIQCRYLYCSRMSLRMPDYHLIGEEAFRLLSQPGYHVTLRSLFQRVTLPETLYSRILSEMGLSQPVPLDRELTAAQVRLYGEKCKNSPSFCGWLQSASQAAYPDTIGYFRQEGLFDENCLAIVDSGWIGSMQRSLRQLLESAGYQGTICGFYFGLYTKPLEKADGEYFTFYFSKTGPVLDKALFNNNVLECILAAPHGMTVGYRWKKGRYEPVLQSDSGPEQIRLIEAGVSCILLAVERYLLAGQQSLTRRDCVRILRRFMARPSRQEAELWGSCSFCDDISGQYVLTLASEAQVSSLKYYSLFSKILRKLTRGEKSEPDLLWPYGTAAFVQSPLKRCWYCGNIFLWAWLKYVREKWK